MTMDKRESRQVPPAARGCARRRRLEGGRPWVVKVRFSEAELSAVRACAAAEQVSVQRFLIDAAFAERPAVSGAFLAELEALRRLTANLANNVNQIARRLNSGYRPDPSVTAAADALRRVMQRLETALARARAVPPRLAAEPERNGAPPGDDGG